MIEPERRMRPLAGILIGLATLLVALFWLGVALAVAAGLGAIAL